MRNLKRQFIFAAALLVLAGCNSQTAKPPATIPHRVTQVSIINALMLGHYDGFLSVQELLQYGNFGLGTCDHLDGELIVLDGVAYQAKVDGTVVKLAPQNKIPFAVITAFQKTGELPLTKLNSIEELEAKLDGRLENRDLFYAIRVEAEFDSITFRSVPPQQPPYRPLVEVVKQQVLHTHEKTSGTLVCFRTPKWAGTLSVPGYHWHFLSADRKLGGHVLNCVTAGGKVAFDQCDSWLIKLPETIGAGGKDVSADLQREVEQVERLRQSGSNSK